MLKPIAAAILAAGLVFGGGTASAASACKGISNSKCEGATSCYWVKGYKTKAGSNVKAHCRAKPGNGSSAKKKSTSKKTTVTNASTGGASSKKATSKKAASKKTTSKKTSSGKKKTSAKKKKTTKKQKPSS